MGATMGKNGGTLLDSLPSTQGTFHIVMLGLDSAGKTTALYRLKFDQYLNTVPTIGFNCEKIRGQYGKSKGVQFLVWDVGGQEKLRPLWRSYTRCTDGIVFVVDSVDVERMEEAKMELMRTAKCPDNQGVPVLILANKQDLPGAREPKELEKLLGLNELTPTYYYSSNTSSHNDSNACKKSGAASSSNTTDCNSLTTSISYCCSNTLSTATSGATNTSNNSSCKDDAHSGGLSQSLSSTAVHSSSTATGGKSLVQFKGWHIQPACAITGEGLQEGLEALYEMIIKKRKINKANKKKR